MFFLLKLSQTEQFMNGLLRYELNLTTNKPNHPSSSTFELHCFNRFVNLVWSVAMAILLMVSFVVLFVVCCFQKANSRKSVYCHYRVIVLCSILILRTDWQSHWPNPIKALYLSFFNNNFFSRFVPMFGVIVPLDTFHQISSLRNREVPFQSNIVDQQRHRAILLLICNPIQVWRRN